MISNKRSNGGRAFLLILFSLVLVIVLLTAMGKSANAEVDTAVSQFQPALQTAGGLTPIKVIQAEHADLSPPLSSIPYTIEEVEGEVQVMPDLEAPINSIFNPTFTRDRIVQDFFGPGAIPPPTLTFEGINNLCNCLPPDPVGAVGPNHYVEMVNVHFAVYDKAGTLMLGPVPNNTLWSGFGGPCEVDNSGDPVVLYDHLADRWILTQFAVDTGAHECIAVSQTPDPTGAYYRYAFNIGGFPDYPKLGLWSDSYLATYRNFGTTFDMQAAAYNRAKMLVGDGTAEAVLFSMTAAFTPLGIDGFLPGDLDGPAPPAGTFAPFMGLLPDENGFPADALALFGLDVDWNNPGGAVLNGPMILPVEPFNHNMCDGDRNCIPQPGTAQGLDAIADRIMHRLVFRDFGFYQALVAVHTVNAGTEINEKAGLRWYELRGFNNMWGVYQQGTYAPDADHRWMGSIGMDAAGNIAMGYSVSSDTTFPSIRYTGRLVTDPLGTMPQGEEEIIAGSGAQTHTAARWGDYSAITVDPTDDCTFWYVNEYIQTTGSSPWQTRVGAFTFPNCPAPAFDDFSVWGQPPVQEICEPDSTNFDVVVFEIGNYNDAVSLSAVNVPAGYSASFGTNPVTPPDVSSMLLTNNGASSPGLYDIDVVGTGPTSTHTSTVSLNLFTAVPVAPTLTSPPDGAINQPVRPVLEWSMQADATSFLVEVADDAGFTNIVDSAMVVGTTYQVQVNLDLDTTYYWRVTPDNPCGNGAVSAVFSFITVGDGTSCPAGSSINYTFVEDFDSGAAGWTHTAPVGTDTWALQNTNPSPGSGDFNYHADDLGNPANQQLVSPDIILPSGSTYLTMQFLNEQAFEDPTGSGGCWDGGTLEISTDSGSNWVQLDAELLSDPYDGIGDNGPPAGVKMWCGESGGAQPWLNSIVDMSAYDGQTVRYRFSLLSDAAANAPGWNIDDVVIASCEPTQPVANIVLTKTVGFDPNTCATTNDIQIPAGGGGTEVTYCYTVQNTGNVTLTNHTLVDDQLGTLLLDEPYNLGPLDTFALTTTILITETTVNIAEWTATNPTIGMTATYSTAATVTRLQPTDVGLTRLDSENQGLGPIQIILVVALVLVGGLFIGLRQRHTNKE